jgi:hypothetical protein
MARYFNFITDFTLEQSPGGAEKCDNSLLKELEDIGYNSNWVSPNWMNFNDELPSIVSNRSLFDYDELIQRLKGKPYIVIEHDYQILVHRNPYMTVHWGSKTNPVEFYNNAKEVVFQSSAQVRLFNRLAESGVYPSRLFGTPFFSRHDIKLYKDLYEKGLSQPFESRQNTTLILNSKNWIKGTKEAEQMVLNEPNAKLVKFPVDSNIQYEFNEWKDELVKHQYFAFLPQYPESFSRVLLEACLAGCELLTSDNTGFFHWFFELSKDGKLATKQMLLDDIERSRYQWLNYFKEFLDAN